MDMDDLIRRLLDLIPVNHVFDTHTIIEMMLQQYPDEYLKNAGPYSSVELYHGYISKAIKKAGVKDCARAYSKNIKDNFSTCECWKKE
jgi:hypothetical protein